MAVRIPAPPSHRRPTPDHPPYAEMVQRALKTLAEPRGSTESSISIFIQANYTSLPWGHSKLLPYYLNKLLIAGEVLRSKSDPNCYVLRGHSSSLRKKKKYVKKDKRLQGEVHPKRSRGRPKKYNSNSGEKMIVSENAVKEQKGTILKFKRKCPEGDANASDGGWMFSNNNSHEQEDEALYGAECNEQNNMLLALPAFKSSNTKMKDDGCNEKVVELQKKPAKGMEIDIQNEILLASDGKDFGDTKVDVNAKETTLQEEDYSAIKINDNHKSISVLQDKNRSLSVNAENSNEKDKDIGHMKIGVNGEKMLALEEKDCSAAKIDENDEVLVLQDKKCSLSAIAGDGNEILALQEKGIKGVEFNMQSNNSLALKETDFGGMKNDVNDEETLVLQEKDTKGAAFNMQILNLLPLQEKDSGNMKIDVNGEEMSALQEKDTKGGDFNMQNDNMISFKEKEFGDIETNVNGEEMSTLQEKDTKGGDFNMQNDNMISLKEKEFGDIETNVNGEEMSALQEKDTKVGDFNMQNDNMISLKEKEFGDIETNVNCEEMLVLQEKDTKEVELDTQNKNMFPLHEKDSGDTKIDVNDNTVMLASKEKKCSATKIDENRSMSVTADNSNESSLHEGNLNVCKNEAKGRLLASVQNVEESPQAVPCIEMDTPSKKSSVSSEVNTPSKKSKPKKLRKLWFES